ncbi:MAG: N-acetylmuramoyl-L-alanine amidase family protein [Terracidiphilus sp.]
MAALLAVAAGSVAAAQAPAPGGQRFVVVLDAAHGGDDAGARLDSQSEKAYTLALSVRLRSLLTARGFSVVTTRESDEAVDADRRAEIADHAAPQACLSLHASLSGSGVHLFVSSLAPADAAPFLAWKTAQAAWIDRSLSLAGALNSALSHASVPVTLGRTALPGIESMTCAAVAVEVSPDRSSGAQGSASLDDSEYQTRVAEALAAALVEWRSDQKGEHRP